MRKMNETNETNVPEEEKMSEYFAMVGYSGSERRVRFRAIELCEASTHTVNGENQNRWHNYTLYETPRGYRVFDQYITQWQGESGHQTLSRVMPASELVAEYPVIVNEAVRKGILAATLVTVDASDGNEE